ncbi:MAG: iron-sulfur cluster repair protein YtfE (RIC family) [Polaribacter sp.]|jgi:iron-sulfur cluster repair protein YtfE (RIC family)
MNNIDIKTVADAVTENIKRVHMKKEELILFPFIKKLVHAHRNNTDLETPPFGTVDNPS